jgi:membrane-bound serine protease (ClpP class)
MAAAALADPNLAFLLLIVGALGVYWELHAPGMVAPGVVGVVLMCLGAYGLFQDSPTWYGVALLTLAILLLGIELKFYTHMISGAAGTVLLALGAILLIQGPRRIAPALAIAVSLGFGLIAIFLGILAGRALKSRVLTGLPTLVGATGISRTEIDPEGTVFVDGAYWQARSDHTIPAGQRVSVERVDNLVLFVKEA